MYKILSGGYLYFAYCPIIYSSGIHHIKIGISTNLVNRLISLQTGNSFKIVYL